MTPYLLMVLMVLIGMIGHDFSPRRINGNFLTFWLWATVIIMGLIAGLRYHCGIDTSTFQYNWEIISPLKETLIPDIHDYSFGDRDLFLYAFIKWLGGGVWTIQIIAALWLNCMVGRFALRECRLPFTMLLMYLCICYIPLNMEAMRQGVALGCLLWGWSDLKNRKYLPFYLKILLGIITHASLIFAAILPLLASDKILRALSRKECILALTIVIGIFGLILPHLLIDVLLPLTRDFPENSFIGYMGKRIAQYAPLLIMRNLNWKGWIGICSSEIILPVIVAFLLFRRSDRNDRIFALFSLLSAWIILMSLFCNPVWRLAEYTLTPLFCAIMRLYPQTPSPRSRRLLWGAAVLLPVSLALNSLFKTVIPGHPRYELYYPYTNWIDRHTDQRRDSLIKTLTDYDLEHTDDWKNFGR